VEPEDIGKVLNKYFTSVFTQENEDDGLELKERDYEVLVQIYIEKDKVLEVLAAVKVDNPPGPGGLCPGLLWEAREGIAGALTQIFNSSLSTGVVSEYWTIANVVLLFKDCRDKPGN